MILENLLLSRRKIHTNSHDLQIHVLTFMKVLLYELHGPSMFAKGENLWSAL